MPAYDYRCPTCGQIDEIILPMAEAPTRIVLCRTCLAAGRANPLMQRVYHPTHVTYVSPGFYTSDNRDDVEKFRFEHLWREE